MIIKGKRESYVMPLPGKQKNVVALTSAPQLLFKALKIKSKEK